MPSKKRVFNRLIEEFAKADEIQAHVLKSHIEFLEDFNWDVDLASAYKNIQNPFDFDEKQRNRLNKLILKEVENTTPKNHLSIKDKLYRVLECEKRSFSGIKDIDHLDNLIMQVRSEMNL